MRYPTANAPARDAPGFSRTMSTTRSLKVCIRRETSLNCPSTRSSRLRTVLPSSLVSISNLRRRESRHSIPRFKPCADGRPHCDRQFLVKNQAHAVQKRNAASVSVTFRQRSGTVAQLGKALSPPLLGRSVAFGENFVRV